MRTTTYLRYSLLIPLLLWGVVTLVGVLATMIPQIDLGSTTDSSGPGWLVIFFAFYIFGIIVWIFPYLLLSAILFLWSFIGQPRTALKVFALSPLAMTVLTIAALNLLALLPMGDAAAIVANPVMDRGYIIFNVMGAAFALVWGYICVGIGYGGYRLLERRGAIKDESASGSAAPMAEAS